MIDPAYALTLAEYNAWMNEKLFRAASELSDEQRKADRGAFFGSIHGTLNHILWADDVWLSRLEGLARPAGGTRTEVTSDFERLRSLRRDMDERISSFARRLTPEWLRQSLEWKSGSQQRICMQPRWLLVTHLFNHATHHRGQLTTLLTQAGIDVGVTDLAFSPAADRVTGMPEPPP
jgi:uncharacterized damage-inducible protein DinB